MYMWCLCSWFYVFIKRVFSAAIAQVRVHKTVTLRVLYGCVARPTVMYRLLLSTCLRYYCMVCGLHSPLLSLLFRYYCHCKSLSLYSRVVKLSFELYCWYVNWKLSMLDCFSSLRYWQVVYLGTVLLIKVSSKYISIECCMLIMWSILLYREAKSMYVVYIA